MQSVSSLFKDILETGIYTVETKLLVNDAEYGEDSIMSLSVNNSLFSESHPVIGSAVSGEIDVELIAQSADVPRMASLKPYVRVKDRTRVSEWISKGVYYADTRSENKELGRLSIHGYDSMMKAEQVFTTAQLNAWGNSKTDTAAVKLIADTIGVAVDSRTVLGKYNVPKPVSGDGAESMRDYLRYIAAAYGGNWTITFDNKLLLCKLNDLPAETFYLVNPVGENITFGGDRIVLR